MKNPFPVLILFVLLLAGLLIECKDTRTEFSPGPGDARITGTWQLYERRFPKDSTLSIQTIDSTTTRDTVAVQVGGQMVKRDTLITKYDTLYVRRDTSFYAVRQYRASDSQTLTFGTDGKLMASGSEMTYYSPIKYYRVDTTYPDSLFIKLFITTNRATSSFQQGLAFAQDTLLLKPDCDQPPCYSKFLRVR